MKLFRNRGTGKKKWRTKALLINPHKTKIIFTKNEKPEPIKHVPPWIYEKMIEKTRGFENSGAVLSVRNSVVNLTEHFAYVPEA